MKYGLNSARTTNEVIDLYCERLGPGLLAEPLNAFSNLGFIAVGCVCLLRARHDRRPDSGLLAALLLAIGLGSGLFHSFATAWSQWLDVIPIAAFQLTFLTFYLRNIRRLGAARVMLGLSVFIAALGLAGSFPGPFNGSLAYAPALLVLVMLGLEMQHVERRSILLWAGAVFAVSLSARSVDLALCGQWPYGTHFMWHALNAVVLYLAVRAYSDSPRGLHMRASLASDDV